MKRLAMAMAASASVLVAACETAPVDEAPVQADLEVDVLDCGTLEVSDMDVFSSAGDYAGETDTLTDTCFLVRHPEGTLLWDLGLPGMLTESGPQTLQVFTISLDKTLTEQLAALGLTPEDIDYVSVSHSHFDHIGQAGQVQDALWLVHEDELKRMFPPEGAALQVTPEEQALIAMFEPMERETFRAEYDVFGDGSVVIFETPGHTPGHTSLQLMMPETGPVLLTGDLYHREESRKLSRVPRFNSDEAATRASMETFEARADRLGAKVIIQHEPADIEPLDGKIR